MQLEHGHEYQGAADLPWPLSSLVTEQKARDYLAGQGWRDVRVWLAPSQLPPDWPHTGRSGDVFARAVWGRPSGPVELPGAVLWAAPSPPPTGPAPRPGPTPGPAPAAPPPPAPYIPFRPDFRPAEKAVGVALVGLGFAFAGIRAALAVARSRRSRR